MVKEQFLQCVHAEVVFIHTGQCLCWFYGDYAGLPVHCHGGKWSHQTDVNTENCNQTPLCTYNITKINFDKFE